MAEKVIEREFSTIQLMRSVVSSFDNVRVIGNDELLSSAMSMTTLEEKAKILGGIKSLFTYAIPSSSDLLEQENMQLRSENLILRNMIRNIEERLANIEASLPSEKVIILRELSREEAKDKIKTLFSSGKTLYYSDIVQQLGLDLELVVDICNELQKEGEITADAGVS